MSKDGKSRPRSSRGSGSKAPKATFTDRLAHGGLSWLLMIGIVVLLVVVFRMQRTQAKKFSDTEDEEIQRIEAAAEINVYKNSALDFTIQTPHNFYMEDIVVTAPTTRPPSEENPASFDTHWVMQAGIHLAKAETAYNEDRLSSAIEHYRAAEKIFPELQDIAPYIALVQIQQREYSAAIKTLSAAIAKGANSAEVYNNLGVAQLATEDFDAAATSINKALELKSTYILARYNLASLHYKQEEYAAAAKEFDTYVATNPNHIEAAQTYAHCLLELEQWDKATTQLRKVIGGEPDAAAPHFFLAQTLSISKQFPEAMDSLKHAINLAGTENALAWMARKEFDTFRTYPEFAALFKRMAESTQQ